MSPADAMRETLSNSRRSDALLDASNAIRITGRRASFLEFFEPFKPWDATLLSGLTALAQNHFETFAAVKLFLESSFTHTIALLPSDALASWCHALLELGDYSECITFCDRLIEQSLTLTPGHLLQFYQFKAKALRNLGLLEESLTAYRHALRIAEELGSDVDLCRILVLIGKVYGNYFGQKSLFLAFVEEAQRRLQRSLALHSAEDVRRRRMKTLALCEDTLGQAFRHQKEFALARKFFRKAFELNKLLENTNGMVRAQCHLAGLDFASATTLPRKRAAIKDFEAAVSTIRAQEDEQRALGIRWVQFAEMLDKTGNTIDALVYLDEGERIARKFEDFRTIVRALLLRHQLTVTNNSDEALRALKEASLIAKKYNLRLLESEVHRMLAPLIKSGLASKSSRRHILERNREIFHNLLRTALVGLQRCASNDPTDAEFTLLTADTRQAFYIHLLADLKDILRQLEDNASSITGVLLAADDLQQELVVIGMSNLLARELLHKVKSLVPIWQDANRLNQMSDSLAECAGLMSTASCKNENLSAQDLERVSEHVSSIAHELRGVGETLQDLRKMLANRLAKPYETEQLISVNESLHDVIDDVASERGFATDVLSFRESCSVMVQSDANLMRSVLRNLVINALEDEGGDPLPNPQLMIELTTRSTGDSRVHNPSVDIDLIITNRFANTETAELARSSIRRGFHGEPSMKRYGSGVGLELAKLVFDYSLSGTLSECGSGLDAGIKVTLTPGDRRVVVASLEGE